MSNNEQPLLGTRRNRVSQRKKLSKTVMTTSGADDILSMDDAPDNLSSVMWHDNASHPCPRGAPSSADLFLHVLETKRELTISVLVIVFTLITTALFADQVVFILRHFPTSSRGKKSIWVLAMFPVFSIAGTMGYMVPKSSILVDLISNGFMGSCLYFLLRLLVDYIGGGETEEKVLSGHLTLSLRSPPCCCCCPCLPNVPFTRRAFIRIQIVVLQVAIIRPLLMFIAAIAWTDGVYHPGLFAARNAAIYITILNLISTLVAIYGLLLMRNTLNHILQPYNITGKILLAQLTLLASVLPGMVAGGLVSDGKLPCSPLLSAKDRGLRVKQCIQVFILLPIACLGRFFFRRKLDGSSDIQVSLAELEEKTEKDITLCGETDNDTPLMASNYERNESSSV